MAVTLDNGVAGLNQFAVKKAPYIHQKLRVGLEWEKMMTPRACEHTYSAPNAVPTELIQAYQWQFTPKGSVDFSAVENTLQPIKIDIMITAEDLEVFWDSYMIEWHEIGLDPMEWSFPRYLYEQVYLPKILEEMNQNAWSGTFLAPTTGTAGLSINSVDGYKKKIEDAITAGDLTEYPTGPLLANTMVNQMESWCDSLPIPYRNRPGAILMSPTNAQRYWRDYRTLFGTGNSVNNNENNELRIDATQKRIKPVIAMEGSDRIIFNPDSIQNQIWGTRVRKPTYFNLRWEKTERIIKGLAEIYRFYGFEFWDHLFVNDQA